MLSGYDFSNCDIPVRLNHFFVCECWSGREGSPKNSLRSDNRKLFWEKAVLWRGSSQNATMTGLRSEFLFHTEVLLENWDLLNSENKKKKKNLQRTKIRWIFSVCCWVSEKPEAQTGLERLWWRGCTVHLAWDVRATSPTSPTDDRQSHREAVAKAEGQSYPGSREGLGWAEGGRGHVTANFLKTNLCRRQKETEKTTLAEHP